MFGTDKYNIRCHMGKHNMRRIIPWIGPNCTFHLTYWVPDYRERMKPFDNTIYYYFL